jgi:hypothetical protein
MSEPRRRYIAYLLRLWQVRCEEGTAWRASLESARSGERMGFASLNALFDFLRTRTEEGEVMGDEIAGGEERRPPDSEVSRREENT